MSEGISPRAQAGDWADRLDGWRRRHGLHIAVAVVFMLSCMVGMAATSLAFHAFTQVP
jgi:hypothetical protein